MKIIVINEENHGMIGIAKDYKSAIDFLLHKQWLTDFVSVVYDYINYNDITVQDFLGKNWKEKVYNMSLDEFNEIFDASFLLTMWNVYDAEISI